MVGNLWGHGVGMDNDMSDSNVYVRRSQNVHFVYMFTLYCMLIYYINY